ncbi:MAG TPA: serine/threonine-protein kinase, partial [Planctomycetia bacterium]|nr:serine/threonine-protein kinase [Planctomycetia bacterium]
LGRGGMGIVYGARQQEPDRLVALKLIRDGALASPSQRARFRIEAEAAARLQHPGVVAIHEVGSHDGAPYFTMEYVAGGTLESFLSCRPQPPREAAAFVAALARAVAHAHAEQVVHRDLKPANILLATADGEPPRTLADGRPKIADFGLAKRLDAESTAWTQDGAILGTAGYMAPEQAAGELGAIGPPTDIHALGAILYALVSGRPPFQADSWRGTLDLVLHDDAVPPSRLLAEVPRDLEVICLKCLEKEPGARYARAEDLAADLDNFLAGAAVTAAPPDAARRIARRARRDDFELGARLGRGPRSVVYQATAGVLKQPVAVKVFNVGLVNRRAWDERLARDAEHRAAIAHPQLVPILRAGWWSGAPFVATELAPHGCLANRLAKGALPPADAVRLVERVAELVAYLHRQGLTHGNLKPSNVLLGPDDVPRLVDFQLTGGMFLAAPSSAEDAAAAPWLPPENLRDPDSEAKQYTDFYGLGALLYACLAGRPPFVGASVSDVCEQVQSADPPPPSQFNPAVAPRLDKCVLTCLSKNPYMRPYRAHDIVNWLRRLRENADGAAPPRPRRKESWN